METIINEAKTLIGSLGTYARLIVVGVWFPGFLLFCEIGSLYFRFFGPVDEGLLSYIAERIKDFDSAVMSGLLGVLVLAISIATGYVSRDLAFAISDLWLRKGWRPTRKLSVIYADIRRVHGDSKVDDIAANYPVFRLATSGVGPAPLPRLPDSYVREFCKQWLRLRAPSLNTEGLEIEINMVIGLVIPVALASAVFLGFVSGWLCFVLAGASLAAATFMMYRIVWARTIETEQAMTNFLFAHWEGLATASAATPS